VKLHHDLLKRLAFTNRNGVWELKLKDPDASVMYQHGTVEICSNSLQVIRSIASKLEIPFQSLKVNLILPERNEHGGLVFKKKGTVRTRVATTTG